MASPAADQPSAEASPRALVDGPDRDNVDRTVQAESKMSRSHSQQAASKGVSSWKAEPSANPGVAARQAAPQAAAALDRPRCPSLGPSMP